MNIGYVLFVVDVVNGGEKRWYLTEGGYTENINFANVYSEIPENFNGYIILKHEKISNLNTNNIPNVGILPESG